MAVPLKMAATMYAPNCQLPTNTGVDENTGKAAPEELEEPPEPETEPEPVAATVPVPAVPIEDIELAHEPVAEVADCVEALLLKSQAEESLFWAW